MQDSLFTLRETHRSAAGQAVAPVCLVLLLALIDPYDTNDSLSLGGSIGYRASIFMTVADDTIPRGLLSPSVTTATPSL